MSLPKSLIVTDIRISANDMGRIESYLLLKNYRCKIMKNKFVVQTNLLIICVIVSITSPRLLSFSAFGG